MPIRKTITGPDQYRTRYFLSNPVQCERCGFVPEDPCQVDVHHKDGNHTNNDMDNFKALCANCHRIVTKYMRGRHTKGVNPLPRALENFTLPANCTPIKYEFRPKANVGIRRKIVAVPLCPTCWKR